MKRGGEVIYAGPLGRHSHKLIEYFEVRHIIHNLFLKYFAYENSMFYRDSTGTIDSSNEIKISITKRTLRVQSKAQKHELAKA